MLRITPDKGGALRFQLNVRGANFHICELSGVIRSGEARALLTPIAKKCGNYLSELDNAWVHNDLALTQHRAGDSAACRSTLKPWLELARTPDETINGNYPPPDAAEMLRIAQATRANMRLCGAPVTIGARPKL